MKGGSITFNLATDPLLRVVGEIGADGTYSLRTVKDKLTADGIPEGEYQVTIQPPAIDKKGAGGQGKHVEPIVLPRKYKVEAKDSTLKIELPIAPP